MSVVINPVLWLALPRFLSEEFYRMEPCGASGRDVTSLLQEINTSEELGHSFSDWRLPTLEEITELSSQGLLKINKTVWTSTRHLQGYKVFNPWSGYIGAYGPKCFVHVLPVRG
ncbi:DUF1566 domain-containing protein [Hydrogenophaga sp. NFH-34]|uniref:DUF1566 domain-containing protein n=1 Tax=Hydrogenophaga sp. NFH-34 TaxID=2744446 RepID=UPI001F174749|nr:DUF1566 domain-containing protein [Hydrogenophaga sp. NFH-34]